MSRRLTQRAEEALFGAVLLHPEQLPGLQWIPAAALSSADHAAFWRALCTIDFRGVPSSDVPRAVSAAVDQIEDAGIRECLQPARITEFVSRCPDPHSAATYAGMALDAATHRSVEESGLRLRQTGRETPTDQAAQAVAETEQQVQQRLAALDRAWSQAPETVRTLLDTSPQEPVAVAERDGRVRTDLEAEHQTVAALLTAPEQIHQLPQLRPEDYSDPHLAAAYRAMSALSERQAPIDTLTVAWEAHRRGQGLSEELLETLERASAPSAVWSGDQVLATAALDRVDAAGNQLRNLGRLPALAPSELISHSTSALQPLTEDQMRLQATHEIEPAQAETEPTHATTDDMEIDA